ncbi:hypothetical protein SKAU_G00184920 [Synaphobranchus kaupii]|uniref:Uncharacterized protein n=1 Tax=Synaphobranchus kaupii TaxID=118154 RepID=A0A9Q1FCA4_SYNKA|nr:hypothetical protein SKAU_G00184920 [Synaphobranchus kaupii]
MPEAARLSLCAANRRADLTANPPTVDTRAGVGGRHKISTSFTFASSPRGAETFAHFVHKSRMRKKAGANPQSHGNTALRDATYRPWKSVNSDRDKLPVPYTLRTPRSRRLIAMPDSKTSSRGPLARGKLAQIYGESSCVWSTPPPATVHA